MKRFGTGALFCSLWLEGLAGFAAGPGPITPQQAQFFEARVRPLLVEHCVRCHGRQKQKGGLRLDSSAALLKGSDNGAVVTAGDPENSLLVKAIRYDSTPKMPPKQKLAPEAIDTLTTWVKMGAPWPELPRAEKPQEAWKRHWAFQPIRKPALPHVQNVSWPQTPIDRFILARFEAKGLTPSAPADRRTLIRRVTFDLLGLPPTPAEVAAFETDPAPDAFARLVDRLLTSPHYGERWGRYWLDVARYADTKGYVFFEEADFPWAYTYRDYVIRAFNSDLRYDRFILQQLAADQLVHADADRQALPALGFLTVGGRFMNNMQDILDDRIDVVTRGLLGLTVTCARCHDHKFDPIPSADYYSLYGVFASCTEPDVAPLFEDPPHTKAYAAFEKELRAREQRLAAFLDDKRKELSKTARTRFAEYLLAAHALHRHPTQDDFMLLADGGDLNPTMVIRWKAYLDRTRQRHHAIFAPWHALAALPEKDFATRARTLVAQFTAQGNGRQRINPLVAKALADRPPQTLADAARRYGELLNGVDQSWQQALQRAAASRRPAPSELADPAHEELRQVLYGPDSPPSLVANTFTELELLPDRPAQAKLQELRKAVETWRATGAGAPPRAMVLVDLPTPYSPRVFRRGNPNNLGDAVPRQFLGLLAGNERRPFEHGSGRLDLAQAIVAPSNPLTARVLVNRIWAEHFGVGLVRTPSDFGLRSEPPSHPELLDYLASTFMENGWSIKKLHRRILLSAVYQQRSDDRPECRVQDPENILLWKMNRRRLDFEATRDALLAVGGALDERIGGPPVRDITAPAANRRTVYGYLDRLNVPGLYRTFDFPSPDATSPHRDTTTVPPQALFLMNNPFAIEQARRVTRRPEIAGERDPARRVDRLFRLLYSRPPTAEEVQWLTAYLAASANSTVAWDRCAQALLLANEFVFID
jgi:mono/diheme cytochrome c family protein